MGVCNWRAGRKTQSQGTGPPPPRIPALLPTGCQTRLDPCWSLDAHNAILLGPRPRLRVHPTYRVSREDGTASGSSPALWRGRSYGNPAMLNKMLCIARGWRGWQLGARQATLNSKSASPPSGKRHQGKLAVEPRTTCADSHKSHKSHPLSLSPAERPGSTRCIVHAVCALHFHSPTVRGLIWEVRRATNINHIPFLLPSR